MLEPSPLLNTSKCASVDNIVKTTSESRNSCGWSFYTHFSSVKVLVLDDQLAQLILPALRELGAPAGRVTPLLLFPR